MNNQTVPDFTNPVSPDYIEPDEQDIFDKADEKYEELQDREKDN